MPTGNTANAKIQLDISDVQAKIAQNKALLEQIQAAYEEAGKTVKQSVQEWAEAQQGLNQALNGGATQAASAAQIIAEYKARVDAATQAQTQLGVQLLLTKSNLADLQNQLAQLNSQASGGAGGFAGMRQAYAQASILGAVISGNPNGLVFGFARLATTSATMRSLLSVAFPVVGAVALTEVLYEAATGVYHLYQRFIELKNVEEEVAAVQKKLWDAADDANEKAIKSQEELLREQGKYVAAADLALKDLTENKKIDLSKFLSQDTIKEKFKDLGEAGQKELQDVFTQEPKLNSLNKFVSEIKSRVEDAANVQGTLQKAANEKLAAAQNAASSGDAGSAFGTILSSKADERQLNQAKAKTEIYTALLKTLRSENNLYTEDVQKASQDRIKAQEDEARKAEELAAKNLAAFHKVEEEKRQRNEEAMTSLRLEGAQAGLGDADLVDKKIKLVQDEIAAEKPYYDVIRELNRELASFEIEKANQVNELRAEGLRLTESFEKRFDEARRARVQRQLRDLEEEYETEKKTQELREQLGEADIKKSSDSAINSLDLQKTQVTAAGETSGPQTAVAKQRELQQLQQIDREILDEKAKAAAALVALDAANPLAVSPQKKTQDEDALADLQRQKQQLQITQNAEMLKLMEQQYSQYFNTIQQGLSSSVNRWIETGRGFQRGMQQMGVHLVEDFTNQLIKMGVQWAQHELAKMMIHMATNQAIVTSDLATAAQGKAIRATDTMQTLGANAIKAASAVYYNVADYIPVIGPELAPVAAGAAFAAVMALGALASFDTGGVIPNTGIALVHKGEEVVTAPVTNMVKNMATQQRSTNINMNTTINNSGLTDSSFKRMASSHASQLTNIVVNGLRKQNIR